MQLQTAQECLRTSTQCWVAKKGARYLCERNNELALTTVQANALACVDSAFLERAISAACIDDRNHKVVGGRYSLVQLTRR